MSNKRDNYLKMEDDFFNSNWMLLLKSEPDGDVYIHIWLRLLLQVIKIDENTNKGLVNTSYSLKGLAILFRIKVDLIEKAFEVFKKYELIKVYLDGSIWINNISETGLEHEWE